MTARYRFTENAGPMTARYRFTENADWEESLVKKNNDKTNVRNKTTDARIKTRGNRETALKRPVAKYCGWGGRLKPVYSRETSFTNIKKPVNNIFAVVCTTNSRDTNITWSHLVIKKDN